MNSATDLSHKIAAYVPRPSTIDLIQQTSVLLLAGVAGAGKDSIKAELLKTGRYHRIISHTTRAPRINHGLPEQHGVDYHFIGLAEAEAMLDRRAFVEAKMYSGNIYGTSVAQIRLANRADKVAVADIEVQGVAEYVAMDPYVRAVYVLPPDYEIWQERLAKRHGGTANPEEMDNRMRTAIRELEHALEASHLRFVINHSLLEAAAEIDHLMRTHQPVVNGKEARQVAEQIYAALRRAYPV